MDSENKLLKLFFDHPLTEFHIRQAARETRLHPNTVIVLTEEFAQQGLITKWRERHVVLCKANTTHLLYKVKKFGYNLENIVRSGILEFLNEQLAFPTIILFGSYAKAENHEKSDLDLFIIAETKKKLDLSAFERKLSTEIQLFVHTPTEFNQLKKKSPELINNVINGYKLSGFLTVV